MKLHLKLLHKNDLKTAEDPQKQPPGGVLKKGFRKNFAKLAGQQLEFCEILNTYFVNYQRLTYSTFGKIDFLQYFTFSPTFPPPPPPTSPIFNLGFDFSDLLAEQEKFAKPTLTTLS